MLEISSHFWYNYAPSIVQIFRKGWYCKVKGFQIRFLSLSLPTLYLLLILRKYSQILSGSTRQNYFYCLCVYYMYNNILWRLFSSGSFRVNPQFCKWQVCCLCIIYCSLLLFQFCRFEILLYDHHNSYIMYLLLQFYEGSHSHSPVVLEHARCGTTGLTFFHFLL